MSATRVSDNSQRIMTSPQDATWGVVVGLVDPTARARDASPPGAIVVAVAALVAAGRVAAHSGGLGSAGDREAEAVVVEARVAFDAGAGAVADADAVPAVVLAGVGAQDGLRLLLDTDAVAAVATAGVLAAPRAGGVLHMNAMRLVAGALVLEERR